MRLFHIYALNRKVNFEKSQTTTLRLVRRVDWDIVIYSGAMVLVVFESKFRLKRTVELGAVRWWKGSALHSAAVSLLNPSQNCYWRWRLYSFCTINWLHTLLPIPNCSKMSAETFQRYKTKWLLYRMAIVTEMNTEMLRSQHNRPFQWSITFDLQPTSTERKTTYLISLKLIIWNSSLFWQCLTCLLTASNFSALSSDLSKYVTCPIFRIFTKYLS